MWKAKGSPQRSADSLGSQPARGECPAEAAPAATFSELLQGLHLGGAKKGVGEPRAGLGKILSLAPEGVCRISAEGVCSASPVKGHPASQPGVGDQRWVYPLCNPQINRPGFFWWLGGYRNTSHPSLLAFKTTCRKGPSVPPAKKGSPLSVPKLLSSWVGNISPGLVEEVHSPPHPISWDTFG